ncbi:hypothetical protein PQX77_019256 [Marasmius sp. AFHP31]|nr:hypothetical protein PQX77_019256 [Marasmius sp. AFHP31]
MVDEYWSAAAFMGVTGDLTVTNINDNYFNPERGDLIVINRRTIRRVIDGDIIFRRLLSSEVLSINTKLEGASTSMELQVLKLKKTVQTAEIVGYRGRFTATSLEPVHQKDRDNFVKVSVSIPIEERI